MALACVSRDGGVELLAPVDRAGLLHKRRFEPSSVEAALLMGEGRTVLGPGVSHSAGVARDNFTAS